MVCVMMPALKCRCQALEMRADFCPCAGSQYSILTIWPSFARTRARRRRPNTSTCTQYVCRAGRRKRAPLRSRTWLLHRQRTPRRLQSPGQTKTRDYRTLAGAHRAQTTCAPAHQRARKQAPQSVIGCSMASTVLPYRPSSLLLHSALLVLARYCSRKKLAKCLEQTVTRISL